MASYCRAVTKSLRGTGIMPARRYCWRWKEIHPACLHCWLWKWIHPAYPYSWRWKRNTLHIKTVGGEKTYTRHVHRRLLMVLLLLYDVQNHCNAGMPDKCQFGISISSGSQLPTALSPITAFRHQLAQLHNYIDKKLELQSTLTLRVPFPFFLSFPPYFLSSSSSVSFFSFSSQSPNL